MFVSFVGGEGCHVCVFVGGFSLIMLCVTSAQVTCYIGVDSVMDGVQF